MRVEITTDKETASKKFAETRLDIAFKPSATKTPAREYTRLRNQQHEDTEQQ